MDIGKVFGPYEVVGNRGDRIAVVCKKCGSYRRVVENTLYKAVDEDKCDKCAKPNVVKAKQYGQRELLSKIKRQDEAIARCNRAISELSQKNLVKRVYDLHTKLNDISRKAEHVRSKEIIYTEVFVFLGYQVAANVINTEEYLAKVRCLMLLVESVPPIWFHSKRNLKLGMWVDLLEENYVRSIIDNCEVVPIEEVEDDDELEDEDADA